MQPGAESQSLFLATRLDGLRSRRGLGAGDLAGVFFGFFVDAGVFFGVLLLAGLFAARFGDGAGDDFGVAAFGFGDGFGAAFALAAGLGVGGFFDDLSLSPTSSIAAITTYIAAHAAATWGSPAAAVACESCVVARPRIVSTTPTYCGWRRPTLNGNAVAHGTGRPSLKP